MIKENDLEKLVNFAGELAKISQEAIKLIIDRVDELDFNNDAQKILATGIVMEAIVSKYSEVVDVIGDKDGDAIRCANKIVEKGMITSAELIKDIGPTLKGLRPDENEMEKMRKEGREFLKKACMAGKGKEVSRCLDAVMRAIAAETKRLGRPLNSEETDNITTDVMKKIKIGE